MRVLVTGGAGYIGSHVVRQLKLGKHTPVVLDDLSTGRRALVERNDVEFVHGDAGNPKLLDQIFTLNDYDAVIHIAGKAIVSESVDDPGPYFRTNTVVGHTLLDAAIRHGVRRFVFSSTCAVYGVPDEVPITEQSPLLPVSPYGTSKLAFEHMLRAYCEAYPIRALSLRYFNVAGASAEADLGEIHDPETHVIPRLLDAVAAGTPFNLYGTNYPTRDGTAERDYLHVEDLALAHTLALERLDIIDPLSFGCALNLGRGVGTTVRELVDAVQTELGVEVFVREQPRRPGDPPQLTADPTLAQRILGFGCFHDLGSMIRSANAFREAEAARNGAGTRVRVPATTSAPRNGANTLRFGEVAIAQGYLDEDSVSRALAIQNDRDGVGESHMLLGLILLEMGALSNDQLIQTLKSMRHV